MWPNWSDLNFYHPASLAYWSHLPPSLTKPQFALSILFWQVYADYESNPLLRQGIEFCCRQFYILHRKPFILQLFASVAPLLEFTVRPLTHILCLYFPRCLQFVNYAEVNFSVFISYPRPAPVLVCLKECQHSVFLTCWSHWRVRPRMPWTLWSWSRQRNLYDL